MTFVDYHDQHQNKYIVQQRQGAMAKPGTVCPYNKTEIGKRCAWLAGHYDRHGYINWAYARS